MKKKAAMGHYRAVALGVLTCPHIGAAPSGALVPSVSSSFEQNDGDMAPAQPSGSAGLGQSLSVTCSFAQWSK